MKPFDPAAYEADVRAMDSATLLDACNGLWMECVSCVRVDSSSLGRKDIAERGAIVETELLRRLTPRKIDRAELRRMFVEAERARRGLFDEATWFADLHDAGKLPYLEAP